MTKTRVAILGLGTMGSGMAQRLLSAGFPLSVYNRDPAKAKPLIEQGAFSASSPKEAAVRSEILISMVADDGASRDIWMGGNGALAGLARGSVLIESSTLTVRWVRELASVAAERGADFLDAPVTGTKPHAASGELRFLVGGPRQALDQARPVLSVLGQEIIHLGPTGSGALMKLINNFLAAVQAVSFAEAFSLIKAGGLDSDTAVAVLTGGVPGSPMVKRIAARAASADFTPHFFLRLMAKDLGYALEEAREHQVSLRTAAAALSTFEQAIAAGYGDQDFTAVAQLFPSKPETVTS